MSFARGDDRCLSAKHQFVSDANGDLALDVSSAFYLVNDFNGNEYLGINVDGTDEFDGYGNGNGSRTREMVTEYFGNNPQKQHAVNDVPFKAGVPHVCFVHMDGIVIAGDSCKCFDILTRDKVSARVLISDLY